jgi:hypothetical protein
VPFSESRQEISPNPEAIKRYLKVIMVWAGIAGALVAISFYALLEAIGQLWGNWENRALIDFLKATASEHSTGESS